MMKKQNLRKDEKQQPLHMNIDGCQVTVYFAPQQENSVWEDIKRMILVGLKK